MTYELRPQDFTLKYSNEYEPYPFYEDEDGYITGYGHQDVEAFASEIVRYDQETGQEFGTSAEEYLPHIDHRWAVLDSTEEYFLPVSKDTEGAFPITTLWGYR